MRFGFWEYVALAFIILTIASALGWRYERAHAAWNSVTARVIGLSLVENDHRISAARPGIRVHYTYVVDGTIYRGDTHLDAVTRALNDVLPREVLDLLHTSGYMSFGDLPPAVQAVLRAHGVERLDAAPPTLRNALRVQGYKSVRDLPEDLRRMAQSAEYQKAARRLATDESTAHARADAGRQAQQGAVAPLKNGGTLQLYYDPRQPAIHNVVRVPSLRALGLPAHTLAIALAALTILYCGAIYPTVKQR